VNRAVVAMTALTLVLLSLGLVLVPLAPPARAETLGAWTKTTPYPTITYDSTNGTTGSSCAISGGYIYCVGGDQYPPNINPNKHVYYAAVTSSGIGTWTNTTAYPTNTYFPSCVIADSYITCVGGLVSSGVETNAVYSAAVSSTGVGAWTLENSYPTVGAGIEATQCVASGGFITCVGGLTSIDVNTNFVYYASLSSGTVGTWTPSTSYPIAADFWQGIDAESCVVASGHIICVGGVVNPTMGFSTNAVYYNTISDGAVGATWTATTAAVPPEVSFEPCTVSTTYIYCLGGLTSSGHTAVNYDTISASGLGATWTNTTAIPGYSLGGNCGISGGYLYCVGGETSIDYYSLIGSAITTTTTSSSSSTTTTTSSSSPLPGTTTSVVCSPYQVNAGVGSSCTGTVTGANPSGTITWTQSSGNGGYVTFSSTTCDLVLAAAPLSTASQPALDLANSCSVTATGVTNGTVNIFGTYSGDSGNAGSGGSNAISVGTVSTATPPPPTFNACEVTSTFSNCRTTFLEFTSGGNVTYGTVKLSASGMPTIISNTTSTAKYSNVTVTLPSWIAVEANVPITYSLTLTNGTILSGTVTVTNPWSVDDVNV
jgi:hypothetical protein